MRPTIRSAISESRKGLARYQNPHICRLWQFYQTFLNHVAPDFFLDFVATWFSNTFYHVCFSNMRTQVEKPWVYEGGVVEWASVIGTNLTYSISITTYCDTIKLTVCSDIGFSTVSCSDLCKAIEKAMRQLWFSYLFKLSNINYKHHYILTRSSKPSNPINRN